jgi:hypothetical protein
LYAEVLLQAIVKRRRQNERNLKPSVSLKGELRFEINLISLIILRNEKLLNSLLMIDILKKIRKIKCLDIF